MVPLYYDAPVPTGWIQKMKSSIVRYAPQFSAQRMVLDYLHNAYLPAIENSTHSGSNSNNAQKILAEHEKNLERLQKNWNQVHIQSLEMTPSGDAFVGQSVTVRATISSNLPEEWLAVELIPASKTASNLLLTYRGRSTENTYLYECIFTPQTPCMLSLGLRVTPSTRIFPEALDLKLVAR